MKDDMAADQSILSVLGVMGEKAWIEELWVR